MITRRGFFGGVAAVMTAVAIPDTTPWWKKIWNWFKPVPDQQQLIRSALWSREVKILLMEELNAMQHTTIIEEHQERCRNSSV